MNSLVGQEAAKEKFLELEAVALDRAARKALGEKVPAYEHMNLVFSGPPGTGKTTMANAIADMYYGMGLVKKKEPLIVKNAADLIAPVVGETGPKVRELFKQGKGGVIFIDEFYTLLNQAGQLGFGNDALDQLLTEVNDNRGDTVTIIAGYENELERLYQHNPGFRRRFQEVIPFTPFTREQKVKMIADAASKQGMKLSSKAKAALPALADEVSDLENAGGVENMVSRAVNRRALRTQSSGRKKKSLKYLQTLTLEDFDYDPPSEE